MGTNLSTTLIDRTEPTELGGEAAGAGPVPAPAGPDHGPPDPAIDEPGGAAGGAPADEPARGLRIKLGYKFTLSVIAVIGVATLMPTIVDVVDVPKEWQQIVTALAAFVVGLSVSRVFIHGFSRDFSRLNDSAGRISRGDLSQPIRVVTRARFGDERHDLAVALDRMQVSLRDLVSHMRTTSLRVADSVTGLSSTAAQMNASTEEIASSIEQIARGAELQAQLVEKGSKAIRDLAAAVDLVARSAKEAADAAGATARTASAGGQLATMAMGKMQRVFEGMETSAKAVFRFGEKTREINRIVEVITTIARQTNLLALNATIEAARAGEYGRGFAVVAEEIRKLADGTSRSAEQITALVQEVEEESSRAVSALQTSGQDIEEGRSVITTTGQSLGDIVTNILGVSEKVARIRDLSKAQTQGAEEVVRAIDEIAKVAEDNAAATQEISASIEEQTAAMQEMASSAHEMSGTAEELRSAVTSFRLSREARGVG